MPNKDLSEIVRDGRKHGVDVKRVGDMAFDEMLSFSVIVATVH
ncbi:MAG: hypothetical protein ACTHZH_15585 [Oleiphilaceae bacterium]